jgi:hypothetical protein
MINSYTIFYELTFMMNANTNLCGTLPTSYSFAFLTIVLKIELSFVVRYWNPWGTPTIVERSENSYYLRLGLDLMRYSNTSVFCLSPRISASMRSLTKLYLKSLSIESEFTLSSTSSFSMSFSELAFLIMY